MQARRSIRREGGLWPRTGSLIERGGQLLSALENLLSHQGHVDRQGTDFQDRRKALGLRNVGEAASDLSAGPTVDSAREVGEVDDRPK